MSAMLIMQSLENEPRAECTQEMPPALGQFLNIGLQYTERYSDRWLSDSILVLNRLRLKLDYPWSREITEPIRAAAVPKRRLHQVSDSDSAMAETENDGEENSEDEVDYDFTPDIRDIFDFDN